MAPDPNLIDVFIGAKKLPGMLAVPPAAKGLVIFAHGSGSSRLSPRNLAAAARFNSEGFATLLFDLLTAGESAERRNVFDIPLLIRRLGEAISWSRDDRRVRHLPIALFGASTGAAAAIGAAADPLHVFAVVSRGGRPDLAGELLARVKAPTLLIVGGDDHEVITLNRTALAVMRCPARLLIVPGAGHLFEEPGTLHEALNAAVDWLETHIRTSEHANASVS